MACLSQGGQDDQIRGLSARESDIELVCALSFDRFGDKERRLRRIRWIDTTGYVRTMAESGSSRYADGRLRNPLHRGYYGQCDSKDPVNDGGRGVQLTGTEYRQLRLQLSAACINWYDWSCLASIRARLKELQVASSSPRERWREPSIRCASRRRPPASTIP